MDDFARKIRDTLYLSLAAPLILSLPTMYLIPFPYLWFLTIPSLVIGVGGFIYSILIRLGDSQELDDLGEIFGLETKDFIFLLSIFLGIWGLASLAGGLYLEPAPDAKPSFTW